MKDHALFQGEIIIAKMYWQYLKFFSRSIELILTKLGTNHPIVKGALVRSNDSPHTFSRRDKS